MGAETYQMQLISHQMELEKLYSKNQTIPRIRTEFQNCEDEDFVQYLIEKEIPVKFGIDLLVQMALHKRADIKTLIGLLYEHLKSAQATADMLLKAANADLVDYDVANRLFVVKFEISQDVQDDLDRFQYPLPMVVEPKPIEDNSTSGYYMNQSSVILKHNHHEDDVCLDHLNRMNSIKLTINETTAKMVHNKWKNLDKPKEGEEHEEYMSRKRAFLKYDRTAKDVIALLMQHSDHFYLTHKYDKRGRIYCQGYHVNYQGTPWNKSVVEFAEKEIVE
jgi:hypothetical protein